ncbi:MAG TPA: DUF2934 domain-containing protein [Magnetospirillum sp.]|nr:DUF2934 domain-containing protein [Magnetospirillum sp.]
MPRSTPPALTDDMIRARAHRIWEREGCPDGRADDHWQMARSELAIETAPGLATEPNPAAEREEVDHPEPVEPLEAVENQGSFPGLTDQDEEIQYPRRRRRAQGKRADLPPV